MFHATRSLNGVAAFLLAIMLMLPLCLRGQEATPQKQVGLTAEELSELTAYITKEKKGKEPLTWESDSSVGGLESPNVSYQVVVQTQKKRITLAYWVTKTDHSFSLWWRREPRTVNSEVWTTATNKAGEVTLGVDPEKKQTFSAEAKPPMGVEHRDHWQKETDDHLRMVLEYYRQK